MYGSHRSIICCVMKCIEILVSFLIFIFPCLNFPSEKLNYSIETITKLIQSAPLSIFNRSAAVLLVKSS